MSLISTRGEFNDQFNRNQLSVDIKKVIGTWSSNDNNRRNSIDENDSGAAGHAYIDLSAQPPPTKINIELDHVNVFMKEANGKRLYIYMLMFNQRTIIIFIRFG
jgi:hypothetical protein